MNVVPIVVIHNKSLSDLKITAFIKNNKYFNDVIIYDNSTTNNNNHEIASAYGWHYLTNHKNEGLSTAYNKSIDYVANKHIGCDYFLMLDDDGQIPSNYLDKAIKDLGSADYDVYVPIIYSGNTMLSPASISSCGRVKRIRNISKAKNTNLTAINNGMFVKFETAKLIKYNEKQFLDYVDHDFLRRVKKNGGTIKVLDIVIYHDISINNQAIQKKTRLTRFAIYKKDLKEFYSISFRSMLYYRLHIFIMIMRYSLEYKTSDFIRLYLIDNKKFDCNNRK